MKDQDFFSTISERASVKNSSKKPVKKAKRSKWWMMLQETEIYGHDYLPWIDRDDHLP